LIKEKVDHGVSKVPLLGDIPVLGHLFRNESNKVDKINLVILLTPYIVEKSGDLTSLRAQLAELDAIQARYIDKIVKNTEKLKEKEQ